MVHVLTVDELYTELAKARKMGMGNKKIMLSDDDEGNGYHLCFYAVTPAKEVFGDCPYGLPYSVNAKNLDDYVVVG